MVPPLRKITEYLWEIPPTYKHGMRVPGLVIADEVLIAKMKEDLTLEQVANVAFLPGIYKYSIVLPDGHQGYGFPIGGVAAFDSEEGVLSPGGVGYDINCGVRVLRTDLSEQEVRPRLRELAETLFRKVPSGLGSTSGLELSFSELDKVLEEGVSWAISHGYGWKDDPLHIEERGRMEGADANAVSREAKQRGRNQLGTLGSGNHFLEVQKVDKIYDPDIAKVLGIEREGQITVMIHTGSRGLGHQVASDYLKIMERLIPKYKLPLPDRELVSVPATSDEAQRYFSAMKAAANFAWTNRQIITHQVRESFRSVFKRDPDALGLRIIYDVAHNIAKLEEHVVDGKRVKVYVHRKGATRAFPPGHPEIPADYKSIGQPVLIPGSMGTASYILVGTTKAMEMTFGSSPHGAGRMQSRAEARRSVRGQEIKNELENRGIVVRAASLAVVAEEAPDAYKDVDRVVLVADAVGIAKKVVRMVPIAVVKG
ncbi:MAG: RtcB family protein [Infirmifilum sp.]|uniref:RtcB family protein n=1 Tax=Infirmifilum TaxID=2856573 RepID=UPI0023560E5C